MDSRPGISELMRPTAGVARFRHVGLKQTDKVDFEAKRRVLMSRRPV